MKRLTAIALVILSGIFVVPASPAAAYELLGCRFTTGNLKWQPAIDNSSYTYPAQWAIDAWNSASTQFNFAKVSSGANVRVADGNFGRTWNGSSFVGIALDTSQRNPVTNSCSGGTWDTTIVTWWNRYYADDLNNADRTAIMIHEIGHALGLAHETDGTGCDSPIMARNIAAIVEDCTIWTPRQDDINGANAIY